MSEENKLFFTSTNDNTNPINEKVYFDNESESILKKIICDDKFDDDGNEWQEFYDLNKDNYHVEYFSDTALRTFKSISKLRKRSSWIDSTIR